MDAPNAGMYAPLPSEQAETLRLFLAKQLEVDDLAYANTPSLIARGLANDVYGFRLEGRGLRGFLAGPLVLRLSLDSSPGDLMEREVAALRFVVNEGYGAPAIAAVEASGEALGRPFLVLERAAGWPISRLLETWNLLAAHRLATAFADAHVALHRLPVHGWPLEMEGSSVERRLAPYRDWLAKAPDAQEGFAWLDGHSAAVIPEDLSVCHNDYHPVNVIADRDLSVRVIDWAGADVGDRHGDVAHTLVFMRTEPNRERGLHRVRRRLARSVFLRRYLKRYHEQLPLDFARLRYWEALRAFVQRGVLAALQLRAMARHDARSETHEGQRAKLARYFVDRKANVESGR